MSYRNKTYVIFDGDKDMWAYAYMLGWISRDHIQFDFFNAHDINIIKEGTSEYLVKKRLGERLANTKQAIVCIGDSTRYLYRYIRWEIEHCLAQGIPIVAVNLNKKRAMDAQLCPPLLRGTCTMHVSFNARIIQKALDDFCGNFSAHKGKTDWYYFDSVYKGLGL